MDRIADTEKKPGNLSPGTVFLVGAGPGDPGLITVKGLELIRTADVIAHDYLAAPEFLQESRTDAETIYVGKKGRDHTLEQHDINALLVAKSREGKTVVRLKGGDPYVFGRGGEEAEDLVAEGVPFEVVPGVTSAVAAPAYAGIPVTHRDHASMVTFITGHEDPSKPESAINWELLARNPGTLVFLMGVGNIHNISSSLIKHGKPPNTAAALIRWGATPKQVSLVSTLELIPEESNRKGMKPPAVLVVGGVVQLHDTLAWFEKKPLFGKRTLITRSRKASRRMAKQIAEMGGDPVLFPTISIEPPEDFGPLDRSIRGIDRFDWILFTSVNGVDAFFSRFFELRTDIREMGGPRIGAIGPVTAAAIEERGLKVSLLAKEFRAEGLLALLPRADVNGKRFLIPRAEKAREILPERIVELGGEVEVAPAYRTVLPGRGDVDLVRALLEQGEIDAITFTSSSTVTHFAEMIGPADLERLTNGVVLASIGPITSRTIMENGLPVGVQATEYTVDGLVRALAGHFEDGK